MALNIPSLAELVAPFAGLKTGALREEAKAAGIPFTTFWKLVTGRTADPRMDTVRLLAAYVGKRSHRAKRQRQAASDGPGVNERRDS